MAAPGTNPLAIAGEDGRVLLAQLTVTDDETGEPGDIRWFVEHAMAPGWLFHHGEP